MSQNRQTPRISFIVPLFNCVEHTVRLVDELRTTVRDIPHEIILIDDGSTDGTRDFLRSVDGECKVLVNPKNLGYAATNNIAARHAQGDYLCLLNNDVEVGPGWFLPLLETAERLRPVGMVGNVQRRADTDEIDHTGIFFNLKGKPEHDSRPPARRRFKRDICRYPAATGACLLMRRSLYLELGGFDEGFRNGGEDVDLCLKAGERGLHTYVTSRSVIRHHISTSPGRKMHDEYNSWRLMRRWRSATVYWGSRTWSEIYLHRFWDRPAEADARALSQAFWFWNGIRRDPPEAAVRYFEKALIAEEDRWLRLFNCPSGPPLIEPPTSPWPPFSPGAPRIRRLVGWFPWMKPPDEPPPAV